MAHRRYWPGVGGLIALLALLVLAPVAGAAPSRQGSDSIEVEDQAIKDGTITLAKVTAQQDGWIAVHLDEGGRAGKVIGHGPVKQGESVNVQIKLEEAVPDGGKVWPMLHIDAGTIGTYEFPGADVPVRDAAGGIVMKQITITGTESQPAAAQPTTSQPAAQSPPARVPQAGGTDTAAGLLALALALLIGGGLLRRFRRA